MKQFSYVVRSHDEVADMLQDAGWKMAKMSVISSVLISVFCTKKDRNFMEELVRKLHGFLPEAGIDQHLFEMILGLLFPARFALGWL